MSAQVGEAPSVTNPVQIELQARETAEPTTVVGTKVLWQLRQGGEYIPGTIARDNRDGTYDIEWTYGGKLRDPNKGKRVDKGRIRPATDEWRMWLEKWRAGEKDLRGANFMFAELTDIDFIGCDLTDARFDGAKLLRCSFGVTTPAGTEDKDPTRKGSVPKLEGATFYCAMLIDVFFDRRALKGVKFGGKLRGALLKRVSFMNTSMNKINLIGTTLEKVNFLYTKMEAQIFCGDATCINCLFNYAHVTGAERVQDMQFTQLDIQKPKKRNAKPVSGLLALWKLIVAHDAKEPLAEGILEELMDETDIEAGDDDDADEDGGVDDADEDEAELVSVKAFYEQGAKLLTNWLKKKQARKSFATLEAQIEMLAVKAKGNIDGDVSKAVAKLRGLALTCALERETDYDLNGRIATMRKVLTIDPTQMSKELNNVQFLLTTLEKAQEPFAKETWSDTVQTWLGMRDLIKKLDSERALHVLDCIFSDAKVREGLGAAVMFNGIANLDAPPDGLLLKLKAGPGHHIKERYYDYVKALSTESARIQRLESLKKQATALIGIGLLAMLTGGGNFVWGLFSNKLIYDEWVPDESAEYSEYD